MVKKSITDEVEPTGQPQRYCQTRVKLISRTHASELTHGRLVASRPGSCMRIDARHSRYSPLLRGQYWDPGVHGRGAGHNKKVWLRRPQQPCVRDLPIILVSDH